MRITLIVVLAVLTVGVGVPAFAELQNVEVGGSIRIRGNWFGDAGLTFNDNNPGDFFVEERTTLNVKADFTDDVTAFIELDNYNFFGDQSDARTNPVTGVDVANGGVAGTLAGDVSLYQSFIELREAWGYPLTFRLGRQEVQLGSEWLVGNNDTGSLFGGLSFDGAMARYDADQFSLSAYWLRVAERGGIPDQTGFVENAEDTDLYIVYGSYTGIEDLTIDAYWMWLHGDRTRAGATSVAPSGGSIHTIGARAAGTYSQFDYEIEGAYQFGEALPGTISAINGGGSVYTFANLFPATANFDINSFAFHGDLGYTFDIEYQPRIFVGGAYYDGGDDFSTGTAGDLAFNRLFSDHEYSEFLANTDMSNFWVISGGASAQITEALELLAKVSYFQAVEEVRTNDDNLGIEVGVYGTYQYSEDLTFEAGYAHFFVDDGLEQGANVIGNGTLLLGGPLPTFASAGGNPGDDLNYAYFETRIRF